MTAALTLNVTHLVAKEVGSKKYEVASENNIPSVFPSWIKAAWEKSQHNHFLATEESFVKDHLIPIFQVWFSLKLMIEHDIHVFGWS